MSRERKKAAARSNGAMGQGPKGERGRSHAKMNALQTGVFAKSRLLRGEDPKAYEAVRKQLFDEIHPLGIFESLVVDQMVYTIWHIFRLKRIQSAVLIRTEIVLALTDVAKQAGELFASPDDIDRAFKDALWRDEVEGSLRDSETDSTDAVGDADEESPSVIPNRRAIPATLTLFHNFDSGEIGQVGAAIDRQLDKAMKDLLRLYLQLDEIRARRRTYTAPAIEDKSS